MNTMRDHVPERNTTANIHQPGPSTVTASQDRHTLLLRRHTFLRLHPRHLRSRQSASDGSLQRHDGRLTGHALLHALHALLCLGTALGLHVPHAQHASHGDDAPTKRLQLHRGFVPPHLLAQPSQLTLDLPLPTDGLRDRLGTRLLHPGFEPPQPRTQSLNASTRTTDTLS